MTSPSGSDWHPILLGWSKHTLDFYPQTHSSPSNSFLSKWHHLVAKTEAKWNRSCLRLSSLSSSPHWIWSGLPSRIWPQPLGQGTGTSHLGLGHSFPSGLPASSLNPIILFCTQPPRDPFWCKFYPGLPWPNPPVAPSHTVQFKFSLWPINLFIIWPLAPSSILSQTIFLLTHHCPATLAFLMLFDLLNYTVASENLYFECQAGKLFPKIYT